jgi:hypothetical protein
MELDELKDRWMKSNEKMEVPVRDILNLIQNETDGPVARLKKRFRKGMILIPFIGFLAISKLVNKHDFIYEAIAWFVVAFCVVIMTYFYINYRLVSKMQSMEADVKTNLLKQVSFLEQGLKWRLRIMRGFVVLFIIMLEWLMYFYPDQNFDSWHGKAVWIRILVYAGWFIFFFFLTKFATDHRYKRHIKRLRGLVEEISA